MLDVLLRSGWCFWGILGAFSFSFPFGGGLFCCCNWNCGIGLFGTYWCCCKYDLRCWLTIIRLCEGGGKQNVNSPPRKTDWGERRASTVTHTHTDTHPHLISYRKRKKKKKKPPAINRSLPQPGGADDDDHCRRSLSPPTFSRDGRGVACLPHPHNIQPTRNTTPPYTHTHT